jgi:hypothetical protein
VRGGNDLGWQDVSPSVDFSDTTTTVLADGPALQEPATIVTEL